jgi:hypothetical protein
MYATLRVYEMSSDWDDELAERLEHEFIPALEQLPGFVSYCSIEAGTRVFASVTVFEDAAGAAASNRLAAELVQRRLADRFPSPPEITAGPVRAARVATTGAAVV